MAGSKRALPNDRTVISLGVSAVVGAVLQRTYRFPGDAPLLAIIHWRAPWLYAAFHATYVTLAFTTPLIVVSLFATLTHVFWARWNRRQCPRGERPLRPGVLQSGVELPYKAIRHHIADSIHLVLHIERNHGRREVTEVLRVCGYHNDHDAYLTERRYRRDPATPGG
jgi:hypothetical protein